VIRSRIGVTRLDPRRRSVISMTSKRPEPLALKFAWSSSREKRERRLDVAKSSSGGNAHAGKQHRAKSIRGYRDPPFLIKTKKKDLRSKGTHDNIAPPYDRGNPCKVKEILAELKENPYAEKGTRATPPASRQGLAASAASFAALSFWATSYESSHRVDPSIHRHIRTSTRAYHT